MLTVYLKDGAILTVEATLDAFERALEQAAESNAFVRVQTPHGRTLAINPSNVSLVEGATPTAAPPNGDRPVRPLAQTGR